jgi:DNA-directed RNA polymerase specialized sigma subunit
VKGIAQHEALLRLKNYDESKGQVNTYLQNFLRLKLAPRLNKYQNIVRIPEAKAINLKPLKAAKLHLEEEFNRPPSASELSAAMGLSIGKIRELEGHLSEKDYISSISGGSTAIKASPVERAFDQTYIELPRQDQALVDLRMDGKTNAEIGRLLNLSDSQVNSSMRRVRSHLQRNMMVT